MESELMLRTKYSEEIENQMKSFFDSLNEKDRRDMLPLNQES